VGRVSENGGSDAIYGLRWRGEVEYFIYKLGERRGIRAPESKY